MGNQLQKIARIIAESVIRKKISNAIVNAANAAKAKEGVLK